MSQCLSALLLYRTCLLCPSSSPCTPINEIAAVQMGLTMTATSLSRFLTRRLTSAMQRRRQLQSLAAEAEAPDCLKHRLCSCLSPRCSQAVRADILRCTPGCLQSAPLAAGKATGTALWVPLAQPVLLCKSHVGPLAQQHRSREGLVLCCTGDLGTTHLVIALHANRQSFLRVPVSVRTCCCCACT